jgi:hypothetical protein
MRKTIQSIYYISLVVAVASLLYLLFMLGHSETAPLMRVLGVAALAGVSALTAGILQWAGLPMEQPQAKK